MRTATGLLVLAALLAFPARASATHVATRCSALTTELNRFRSPDLRVRSLLCTVAHQRAYAQWKARRMWHDLTLVKRALTLAGVCWRSVGEVVAWNNYSATARTFMRQWRGSDSHWAVLTARRYERGGGSWYSGSGRNFATYYVLDLCG